MFFWQSLIFLTITASVLLSVVASRVMVGLWVLWTFTFVLGTFPLFVAATNLFTIGVSFLLTEFLAETVFDEARATSLSGETVKMVSRAKKRRRKGDSFEDWISDRNDLVRELRREMRNVPIPGWMSSLSITPRSLTRFGNCVARLTDPKLEYRAFRRLRHKDPTLRKSGVIESPRRIQKKTGRPPGPVVVPDSPSDDPYRGSLLP